MSTVTEVGCGITGGTVVERRAVARGAVFPKCGAVELYRITRKARTKNDVQGLYKCRSCHKQCTANVGTILEDSKIPLTKWFAATMMMCSSRKGISAHWMHRNLDITYKSAWFMAHRLREAMREKGTLAPLTGTVEADETYSGGKPRGHKIWREDIQDEVEMGLRPKPKNRAPFQDKTAVFGMIERGGLVRAIFEYRFNRRKVSDAKCFAALMSQVQGRLLWYCRTPKPENPHA